MLIDLIDMQLRYPGIEINSQLAYFTEMYMQFQVDARTVIIEWNHYYIKITTSTFEFQSDYDH